jgi:hypothetical protein
MLDSKQDEVDFEEAHYHQTINDIVELMVMYGQLRVLMDITAKVQEKYQ